VTERSVPAGDRWRDCEPHLKSRLLWPLLRLYEDRTSRARLLALVERLGTTLDVLEDPDRWFSAELFREAMQAISDDLGFPDIGYWAGRQMNQPGMMGAERYLTAGLASPEIAYTSIEKLGARLNRIVNWSVVRLGKGHVRVTAHLTDNGLDSKDFCRNRLAVLESVPEAFFLPPALVAHPECVHLGDPDCVYEVSWIGRNPWLPWGWAGAVGCLLVAAVLFALGSWTATPLVAASALLSMATGLASVRSQMAVKAEEQAQREGQIEGLQDLLERNDRRIGELKALQQVGTEAALHREEDELIDAVLARLREALDYDRALLLRVHGQAGDRLGRPRAEGFERGKLELLRKIDLSVRPDKADDRLFGNILTSGQPSLVHVTPDYLQTLMPSNRQILEGMGSSSFVAAPVLTEVLEGGKETIGLLVVDRTDPDHPLGLRDQELVSSAAAALGTALSNVRFLHQVQVKLAVNRKYRQYLPAALADTIADNPAQELELGGQERDLAIMFTDIASFTATSAKLPAEDVVRGLNAWFSITDPIIESCGGIVDKRMGDGILVVFLPEHGPRTGRHPVERAAAAAVGMQNGLAEARSQLQVVTPGFAAMEVRHAIHHGSAIVGNMGSKDRWEYTVIGDAVNVCARLEEITPAGAIWLTGEAVDAAGEAGLTGAVFERSTVLRGRSVETRLFSLDPDAEATASGTWLPPSDGTLESATVSLTAEFPAEGYEPE
jgi:class 3 adenylate cyclase